MEYEISMRIFSYSQQLNSHDTLTHLNIGIWIHSFFGKHAPNWCLHYGGYMFITQEALLLVLVHILSR